MKTAVKHCVSSAYQIGTGGGVEGRRGLAPPPIRFIFFYAFPANQGIQLDTFFCSVTLSLVFCCPLL